VSDNTARFIHLLCIGIEYLEN